MKKDVIILLGGNNSRSKHRINGMSKYLKLDYKVISYSYEHRDNGTEDIDFDLEITKLSRFIKDNNIINYSIVAKSVGFILGLQAISNNILSLNTLIGFGLPVDYANYRKVNVKNLINNSFLKSNILCVQADEDPQGDLESVENLISNKIPIREIKDNTHNYDQFKQMFNIAKAFIETHKLPFKTNVENIEANSLSNAIKTVDYFPQKYRFINHYLFDLEEKIYIFSYQNKKYIIKKGNIKKLKNEKDLSLKAKSLISDIKIGGKKMLVVVPDLFKINSRKGYLCSEFIGWDCNELFYQNKDINLHKDEFLKIIEKFNKLHILYKGFLPRNTIIKDNKIYLIDWDKTVINKNIYNDFIQYKASILIGWKYFFDLKEQDIDEIFCSIIQDVEKNVLYLNQYENAFKNMLGLGNISNYEAQKLCYSNIIKATSYKNRCSLMKLDDILHSISGVFPIEIELLIDYLLFDEHEEGDSNLYTSLSNIIKISRLKSFMNVEKKELRTFLLERIKNLLIEKLNDESGIEENIAKIIQKRKIGKGPDNNYLCKIKDFLLN